MRHDGTSTRLELNNQYIPIKKKSKLAEHSFQPTPQKKFAIGELVENKIFKALIIQDGVNRNLNLSLSIESFMGSNVPRPIPICYLLTTGVWLKSQEWIDQVFPWGTTLFLSFALRLKRATFLKFGKAILDTMVGT